MIAKLTVHGDTREGALGLMARALGETEVAGTVTNAAFLARLVAHPDFASGDVDTGLIDTAGEALAVDPAMQPTALAVAAVAVLGLKAGALQGFTLWGGLRHIVTLGEGSATVTPTAVGAQVDVAGETFSVERTGDAWRIAGVPGVWRVVVLAGDVHVFGPGGGRAVVPDPLARDDGQVAGDGVTVAPMPGRVMRVGVAVGDTVATGDLLAVLEAMKMEHRLTASTAGVVTEVTVAEGDQVAHGALLVRLEPEA